MVIADALGRDHEDGGPHSPRERRRSAIDERGLTEERKAYGMRRAVGHLIDRHDDDVTRSERTSRSAKRAMGREELDPERRPEARREALDTS